MTWGSILCRMGFHTDKTVKVLGPRQFVSECIRCARITLHDYMPDNERID